VFGSFVIESVAWNKHDREEADMSSGAATRPGSTRARSESRQRTALVALRLLPHEREELAQAARSCGVTLSEFIRSSAMHAVSGDESRRGTHQ
jgi:hypothetical protein